MSAAGVLDQLSPGGRFVLAWAWMVPKSGRGREGASVFPPVDWGRAYRAERVQPETKAYLCRARFLTELVSSAASMPGAALAAAVVAASGRVSCVHWRRAGILLGRGRM